MRRTRLAYLGDPICREALSVLIKSCNTEAALSLIGQFAARKHLRELLETRLKLLDYWRRTPDIQKQAVHQPVFITGMPKSGSTFLHRLLAHDPDNRVPLMWEVMFPLPPTTLGTFDSDPRITKTERLLRWLRWTNPALAKAHPIGALIPQECGSILGYAFQSYVFLDMFAVPSYEAWLGTHDMAPAYEFHMNFLKHLQWQCPGKRWVLKSSDHVHSLRTLIRAYPEARIVFLHRDPVKVLQAAASQMTLLKSTFSRNIDRRRLGAYEARILYDKAYKIIEFRDNHAYLEDHFMDVRYLDLARDPLSTVRAIYDRFGLEFSSESEARIDAFATAERNRRIPDKYSLTDFSLDLQQEDPRFDLYCERFSVGREIID